jgi:hypothetical protein
MSKLVINEDEEMIVRRVPTLYINARRQLVEDNSRPKSPKDQQLLDRRTRGPKDQKNRGPTGPRCSLISRLTTMHSDRHLFNMPQKPVLLP